MRLQPFVDVLERYFLHATGTTATIRPAYPPDEDTQLLDYTAAVTIRGSYQGSIWFSAGSDLLKALLDNLGETEHSVARLRDLAAEIANTLAGNLRSRLDAELIISVPSTPSGKSRGPWARSVGRPTLIPASWQGMRCYLVVDLEGLSLGPGPR